MAVRDVAGRPLKFQPLWVRVDANRVKLAWFVAMFVTGSAAALTVALAVVPGVLIGAAAVFLDMTTVADWSLRLAMVVGAVFLLTLTVAVIVAAVQLANAEDWVRARFQGEKMGPEGHPGLSAAVADMALAAGLPSPPDLVLLPTVEDSVNAYALGTTRAGAVIGVTAGFLSDLAENEQRAVVAVLVSRVIAGDIFVATAVAGLMGPITMIRRTKTGEKAGQTASCLADGCVASDGCSEGCSSLGDLGDLGGGDDAGAGCAFAIVIALFAALVVFLTWLAVKLAAWIVTAWSRALNRAGYEKADAEGMLLLKDPAPMLSALRTVIRSSNVVGDGDPSYDGIFYSATGGTPKVERWERRRFEHLSEVLGVEGAAASLEDAPPS